MLRADAFCRCVISPTVSSAPALCRSSDSDRKRGTLSITTLRCAGPARHSANQQKHIASRSAKPLPLSHTLPHSPAVGVTSRHRHIAIHQDRRSLGVSSLALVLRDRTPVLGLGRRAGTDDQPLGWPSVFPTFDFLLASLPSFWLSLWDYWVLVFVLLNKRFGVVHTSVGGILNMLGTHWAKYCVWNWNKLSQMIRAYLHKDQSAKKFERPLLASVRLLQPRDGARQWLGELTMSMYLFPNRLWHIERNLNRSGPTGGLWRRFPPHLPGCVTCLDIFHHSTH